MHTKGPWTHNDFGQVFSNSDTTPIATVWNSRQSNNENDSNAALIAAAPELLIELERLIYIVNKLSEWEDHTEKARAVVRKAKGL